MGGGGGSRCFSLCGHSCCSVCRRRSVTRLKGSSLLPFQNVIPAEVSLVCVVKPDEFWDKKVTHFCFWKEKDRLGFEVSGCW